MTTTRVLRFSGIQRPAFTGKFKKFLRASTLDQSAGHWSRTVQLGEPGATGTLHVHVPEVSVWRDFLQSRHSVFSFPCYLPIAYEEFELI